MGFVLHLMMENKGLLDLKNNKCVFVDLGYLGWP